MKSTPGPLEKRESEKLQDGPLRQKNGPIVWRQTGEESEQTDVQVVFLSVEAPRPALGGPGLLTPTRWALHLMLMGEGISLGVL